MQDVQSDRDTDAPLTGEGPDEPTDERPLLQRDLMAVLQAALRESEIFPGVPLS